MLRTDQYKNENPEWRKYYNATLVVPIWHADVVVPRPPIYGFFAVDSLNKGHYELFTREETKAIMLFGADLIALILLHLEIYDRLPEDLKGNHGH